MKVILVIVWSFVIIQYLEAARNFKYENVTSSGPSPTGRKLTTLDHNLSASLDIYGALLPCRFESLATLEACKSILKHNTNKSCGERKWWIDEFMSSWLSTNSIWDRAALNHLSRVHWNTQRSFIKLLLNDYDVTRWNWSSLQEWLKNQKARIIAYTFPGLLLLLLGVLWLSALLFVFVPILVIGLFRTIKPKDDPGHFRRTRHYFFHLIFHIFLGLTALFCIVGMSNSLTGLRLAVEDVSCGVMRTNDELLVNGLKGVHKSFDGLAAALQTLDRAKASLNHWQSTLKLPLSLETITITGLRGLYAGVLWTDAFLRATNYYIGWEDAHGHTNVPFSLNMFLLGADRFAAFGNFANIEGDYGMLVKAAAAADAEGGSSAGVSATVLQSVEKATQVVSNIRRNAIQYIPSINSYNEWARKTVNTLYNWADTWISLYYWSILAFLSLSLIGILLGFVLQHYWRQRQSSVMKDRVPEPRKGLRFFSGFLVFAYSLGGSLYFLVAGILLVASYFTSDICHFVNYDLFQVGAYKSYAPMRDIPEAVIESCMTRRADGSLLENYGQFDAATLSTYLEAINLFDSLSITSSQLDLKGLTNVVSLYGVPKIILPLDWQSLPLTDDEIRWSSLSQERETSVSPALEKDLQKIRPNQTLPIYGLSDINDALNSYTSKAKCDPVCVGSGCWSKRSYIHPENVYRFSRADLDASMTAGNFSAVVDGFSKSHVLKSIFSCVANSSGLSQTEKTHFFNGAWIAAWKAAAMGSLKRASPTQNSEVVDMCSLAHACPIFPIFSSNHDLTLVSHRVWANKVEDDVLKSLAVTKTEDIIAAVTKNVIRYNVATAAAKSLTSIQQNFNCGTLFTRADGLYRAACNGPFADLAAFGTGAALLGSIHFMAMCSCWRFWRTQKSRAAVVSTNSNLTDSFATRKEDISHLSYVTGDEFMHACEVGSLIKVEGALQHHPPNSVRDVPYGNTPLHLAAHYGHARCVEMILAAGWHSDPLNFKSNTPLLAALCNLALPVRRRIEVAKVLLDHGANPNQCNKVGECPLSVVRQTGNKELLSLLESYGPLHSQGN